MRLRTWLCPAMAPLLAATWACGGDDDGLPSLRVASAVSRIEARSCECLDGSPAACEDSASLGSWEGCLGEALDENADAFPEVVACYVGYYEETARCHERAGCGRLEQALCGLKPAHLACGAMPAEMRASLEACQAQSVWVCPDFRPIDVSRRCDGRRDCADGSDEQGC